MLLWYSSWPPTTAWLWPTQVIVVGIFSATDVELAPVWYVMNVSGPFSIVTELGRSIDARW
jgi:hypothetical protein